MQDEIIQALENSAHNRRGQGRIGDPVIPDRQDLLNWAGRILRFLEDLDGDITVLEIREVLEEYNG